MRYLAALIISAALFGSASAQVVAPPTQQERINAFSQALERRETTIRNMNQQILGAIKQNDPSVMAKRPDAEVIANNLHIMKNRVEILRNQELAGLQELADKFFKQHVQVAMVPETDVSILTKPVPGDEAITESDRKMVYRLAYLQNKKAEDALKRVRDALNEEDTNNKKALINK